MCPRTRRVVRALARPAAVGLVLFSVLIPASPLWARAYTLDECVQMALENNITLARAEESVKSSRADLMSSWSGVLPRISGGVGYSDGLQIQGGEQVSSQDHYSGSVSLSQTIFNGSTLASISGSGHALSAGRHSLEWTRRDVIFSAKEACFALLKAERLREVQSESLELAREQLRKTESLFELGSASKSDLLKAQVQVGQAQLSLISAEKTVGSARAGLAYTLGVDVTSDIEVVDPGEGPIEEEIGEFDVAEALARRPDVLAAKEAATASRRSLLAAKAGRWPDVDASVSYSRSQDAFGDLFDDVADDYSRSISLSVSLPIFNGLSTKASIDRAKASLRSYELSLRDVELAAMYDIETARLTVLEQRESVGVAEQAVEQAEEDLKVSEERYRLRAASMLELIDARVAYSGARVNLVEAKYDYEIAKAKLKKALGL